MRKVYFDNAATTPVHEEVIRVITNSLKDIYGNPSSSHFSGRDAKAQLEESRRTIAKIVSCKPGEIFFTSCGTESNNAILSNAVNHLGVTRILTTAIEHPSVFATVKCLPSHVKIEYLKLNSDGTVNIKELERKLEESNEKTLVSVMHANNEVGALNDIQKIAEVSKLRNAYTHSDMVQTMGHLPISFETIKLDFAAASAHKFHGPKGVGLMYVRQPLQLQPFITGGSQERGNRSGTENLASIAGMAKALELATKDIEHDIKHLNGLRAHMRAKLKERFPSMEFLTNETNSLCTVLSAVFPSEFDKEMLLFQLDMKGIACSGGSACSSGANKGSHVLAQFEIPADRKVVRFSFSKFNNIDEIDYCVEKIGELLHESQAL
jgi:cysteine desulfurase